MTKQAQILSKLKAEWMREAAQGKAAAHMSFQEWYSAKVDKTVDSWFKVA